MFIHLQELHRKREGKRLENQQKAEEEIVFLQASGKVSKTAAHKSNVKKKPEKKQQQQQAGPRHRTDSEGDAASGGGATSRKVEDLFQNNARASVHHNDISPRNETDQPDRDYAYSGQDHGETGAGGEPSQSPSQAATKTTIDDLMATLQKLEEDEKFPTSRNEKNEKPRDWCE